VHRRRGGACRGLAVVNVKTFFVDALGSALELELGTPEDVLRHVTPDVLAQHLPRPLWARLLIACIGAPRVDARLVVETIGVPNLCEHVPPAIIWACIAEIGQRVLGGVIVSRPTPQPHQLKPLVSPPPEVVAAPPAAAAPPRGPVAAPGRPIPTPVNEPFADLIDELESEAPAPAAQRTPTRPPTTPRFRQNATNVGRGNPVAARRPQAAAPPRPLARRGSTEVSEIEADTEIGKDGWGKDTAVAVDDSQLVDWSPNDTVGDNDKR